MDPRFKRTKGYKRLANYFDDVIKKDSFQEAVLAIRAKYKMPVKGFDWRTSGGAVFCYPNDWVYINDNEKLKELDWDIAVICKKFGLFNWGPVIHEYISFSEIIGLDAYVGNYEICFLEDNYYEEYEKDRKEEVGKMFPIVLRINPYASNKEIVDFVKYHSKIIRTFQEKYIDPKINLSKIRKRKESVQERNAFIFDLHKQGKKTKEIQSLTLAKFKDSPDEGAIRKIISLERKKRT